MKRQRKNLQSKGTEDSPVKELNEMGASKLSDTEFKRVVIRILITKLVSCNTRQKETSR